ncbi:MAG: hypothetical protein A2351_05635 [Omnitrophica bacterium RIFOXYB12_FULL_50_7]|nr:MAG: hypothetical protein A2351_05635 [Omnitrophica bacterium RIFOXYB12_FULL_50_7]
MRKWYKYWLDFEQQGVQRLSVDEDFSAHSKSMGGYKADPCCVSIQSFFSRFLQRNGVRHDCYDDFLQSHLKKNKKILSLASGRAANEAFLFQQGYCITCSDIEVPPIFYDVQKLFPGLAYKCLDILKTPASSRYDFIVALSLIYLFTDVQLKKAMTNIFQSLQDEGGGFMLDSAGSPDNFLAFVLHDFLLPVEIHARRWFAFFRKGKLPGLVVKHHGYRRTNSDIVKIAEESGFHISAQKDYCFLSEFRRSALLAKLLKSGSWVTRLFEKLGRSIPYVRMFYFKKSNVRRQDE